MSCGVHSVGSARGLSVLVLFFYITCIFVYVVLDDICLYIYIFTSPSFLCVGTLYPAESVLWEARVAFPCWSSYIYILNCARGYVCIISIYVFTASSFLFVIILSIRRYVVSCGVRSVGSARGLSVLVQSHIYIYIYVSS